MSGACATPTPGDAGGRMGFELARAGWSLLPLGTTPAPSLCPNYVPTPGETRRRGRRQSATET